jgi:carboxyl-terminal processing protease
VVVAGPSLAQTSPRAAALAAAEPFRIDRGTSFSASATTGSDLSRANAARRRILREIEEAEDIIGEKYVNKSRVDPANMTREALVSMLHSLDPHSNFYERSEWKAMFDQQKSGYAGVGMSFAEYTCGGQTAAFVVSTFPGTAASRSGLRFGDRIVSVNGVPSAGNTSDEIGAMIRGPVGTVVSIQIERAETRGIDSVNLVRGIVPQPSVPDFYMIRPGVGYIDLSGGFNYTTNDEVTKALHSLRRDGMTSLILDLRGNGGGIVDQAVKIAEKFLPAGELIVSQRGRADDREWHSTNVSPETMPLVLLVDENTASASEIVAGALQDSDRALIVGARTFGKGLVQDVIDLPESTGLTLTSARYFTPTGRSIQRDYSEIGRYEYFSHREPSAEIGRPYYEARTITGRSVFGGNGISPDEVVPSVELNPIEIKLLDATFYFSRELYAGRISGLAPVRPKTLASGEHVRLSDSIPTESLSAAFRSFVRSQDSWNLDDATLLRESKFIDLHLRQSVATAVFGSVAANRVLAEGDPSIARALKSLNIAAQLTQKAAKLRHNK